MIEDIKALAHGQLEEHGAPGLNLRAIARELGLVSSAVYRYVASRDELLTLLIVDAFDAVGAVAEQAAADRTGGFDARYRRVAQAIRRWALEHPHDWALVYGSPVPGYQAPQDTVASALRVTLAATGAVLDGVADGEVEPGSGSSAPAPVHADFDRLRQALGDQLGDDLLGRVLLAWTAMFGHLSFELYGHLHGGITDYDAFYDLQLTRWVQLIARG
jgi:AcrR family transcriptional regulator